MITINYPKGFESPESRVGKKFKFYKIEPYEIKKPEPEPVINIGSGSDRIARSLNVDRYINEMFETPSFADIIDETLESYESSNK